MARPLAQERRGQHRVLRSFTNPLPESEDPLKKTRLFSTEVMNIEILRAQKIFDALNVFELFSSKKKLFIFGFFPMNWKIEKRSKTLQVISSILSKTSPSKKSGFFSTDLRIPQDPGSGLVNDL